MIKILASVAIVALLIAVWHTTVGSASVPRPYDGLAFEYDDNDSEYSDDEDSDEEDSGDEDSDEEDSGDEDSDDEFSDDDNEVSGPGMPASLMATSASLLPKPSSQATDFAKFAPKKTGVQNFLNPAQFIGLDTQGSSMKNANQDLRAAPIIPKRDVGPWMASSIDPDVYRNPIF
jgi:hypothetical protein